jgi:hypothetical protein
MIGHAASPTGLAAPVSGSWRGVPLRSLAERVSETAGVAVVVDRRLDPSTPLTLDAEALPAGDLLRRAASEAGCGLAVARHAVRFVPEALVPRVEAGDRAAARAEAAASAGLRHRLARSATLAWESGSRPADLVATLAESAGIGVEGLDQIPHDHLPEARYPPLPLGESVALVLGHYDLTFAAAEDDSLSIRIIPTPTGSPPNRPAAGEATTGDSGGAPARLARGARGGRPRPPTGMPVDSFSLEAAAPLDELLAALASRFDLKLSVDEAALRAKGVDPKEIVRVRIVETPRDGVLDAILAPLGLEWRIEDGSLRVR